MELTDKELVFDKQASETDIGELKQIITVSRNFPELINNLIFEHKYNLCFLQADDDEDENLELFGIEVSKDTIIATLYFLKDNVRIYYPNLKSINNYILGYDEHNHLIRDDKAMDKWENAKGFKHSYALCADLAPKARLLEFVMQYALSDGGEVSVRKTDTDSFEIEEMQEDLEEENLNIDELYSVSCHYFAENRGGMKPGWGTYKYFR